MHIRMSTGDKAGCVIACLWLFWILFCLALAGGVLFAAFHFIAKYW